MEVLNLKKIRESERKSYEEAILRVQKMEQYLNEILALRQGEKLRIPQDSEQYGKWQELLRYYESSLWRYDYALDEQGFFPKDMPRGVLAEDTLWNLISEVEEGKQE